MRLVNKNTVVFHWLYNIVLSMFVYLLALGKAVKQHDDNLHCSLMTCFGDIYHKGERGSVCERKTVWLIKKKREWRRNTGERREGDRGTASWNLTAPCTSLSTIRTNVWQCYRTKIQEPLAQRGFTQRGFNYKQLNVFKYLWKFKYTRIKTGGYSITHRGSWHHQLSSYCVNV